MTTDLQSSSSFRAPQPQDAFSMHAAGVKQIIGVVTEGGKEKLVVESEKHPGFRTPRYNDAFQMASEGITAIKGAIETSKGTRLVSLSERHCTI